MTLSLFARTRDVLGRLRRCERGLALIEMGYSMPILLTLTAGGTELANLATTQMRVSQLALQVADNASRIGDGLPLASKRITETMINDVLSGAEAQAGDLNLMGTQSETVNGATTTRQKARIIISDLEPVANPNTTNRYRIRWQRCRGGATSYTPHYGTAGATNLLGMGPTGRQVTAPDGTAVMFVEIHYRYQPLFIDSLGIVDYVDIDTVASMIVRDDRDLTQIYNTEGATVSSC